MKENNNLKIDINATVYKRELGEFELSTRTVNCLKREGFKTIEDVLDRQSELKKIRGVGISVLREIKSAIVNAQIAYIAGGEC